MDLIDATDVLQMKKGTGQPTYNILALRHMADISHPVVCTGYGTFSFIINSQLRTIQWIPTSTLPHPSQ
uniref:Uncharacterized protein n=1 Tax=Arion vulgaris TaxID=1028688 RepID=A0A0B6ZRZ2_9EUPU